MKKICSFAIIILAIFTCCIFSACGDKYGKLSMEFLKDGEVINEVVLYLDNEGNKNSSVDLAVKAKGLDKEDIGQVSISSQVSISVTNMLYDGDTVYFTVTANSHGVGELKVTHMSSDKKASISFIVHQKSYGLDIKNSTYLVRVPGALENPLSYNIVHSEILSLHPGGSSDNVSFKMIGSLNDKYLIRDEKNNIIGFKNIDQNILDGGKEKNVTLYPVTSMQGYNDKEYENKTFTIKFVKTLNETNLGLVSHDDYINYLDETIFLIANDDKIVKNEYSLDEIVVALSDKNTTIEDWRSIEDWLSLYNIETCKEAENSADLDRVSIGDTLFESGRITISALAKTQGKVRVKIKMVPKYAGQIEEISTSLMIQCILNTETIDVYKSSQIQDTTQSIDLYDFYNGGLLGAPFSFSPVSKSGQEVYTDLRNMRICITPSILHDDNSTDVTTGTDKNVLEIHKIDGTHLKFTYSDADGKCYSEIIRPGQTLNIRYVEIPDNATQNELNFEVKSVYYNDVSELKYLKESSQRSQVVRFNALTGIKSMTISPNKRTGDVVYNYESYNENKDYNGQIYLDVNSTEVNALNVVKIFGADNKSLISTNLTITVRPVDVENNNSKTQLKLKQNDGAENFVSFNYQYLLSETNKSFFEFVFEQDKDGNPNTKIGLYSIEFAQEETKFSRSVLVNVYKSIANEDISLSLSETEELFKNIDFTAYTDASYIVAMGTNADLRVNFNSSAIIKSNIVSAYEFNLSAEDALSDNLESYMSSTRSNTEQNVTNLKFKNGTFVESLKAEGKAYQVITLTVVVSSKKYDSIIKESDEPAKNNVTTSFFIYEPVTYSNIALEYDATRYMEEYLSPYYEDQSKTTIRFVSLNSTTLLNYVQPQTETDQNFGKGEEKDYTVVWFTESPQYMTVTGQDDKSLEIYFKQNGQSSYEKEIYAQISQFGTKYIIRAKILVKKPVISTQVVLNETGEYEIDYDQRGDAYINLKEGDKVDIKASLFSKYATVADPILNPEYIIQVSTSTGNVVNEGIIEVNQISNSVHVKNLVGESVYYLTVFAKDALKTEASSSAPGYNNPSAFMNDIDNAYRNAYVQIKLIISNGSETAPYLIKNAKDFWNIKDNTTSDVYYKVMNDINLSNYLGTMSSIKNFSGNIITDSFAYDRYDGDGNLIETLNVPYQISIYGIRLNNDMPNLFTNFTGEISNLTFNVVYSYCYTSTESDLYLGVIDENKGALSDVYVKANGNTSFNGVNTIYFGGLAGKNTTNSGSVEYGVNHLEKSFDHNEIYVEISGNAKVVFGGLVGVNNGVIKGNLTTEQSKISTNTQTQLLVQIEDQSTTAVVNINSSNNNVDSVTGGLVGLNYNGKIKNIYVIGSIIGNNNVGGLIGSNTNVTRIKTIYNIESTKGIQSVTLTGEATVENVKVLASVSGKENIGGIVGVDENGYYTFAKCQVTKTLGGITGANNVGGIAGKSTCGIFHFNSVMSYKWKYNETDTFAENADIYATGSNVAGIVGFAVGATGDFATGENVTTLVYYSSVNAFIDIYGGGKYGGILTSDTNNILFNAYFVGSLCNNQNVELSSLANGGNALTNYVYIINTNGIRSSKAYYINGNIETDISKFENYGQWASWDRGTEEWLIITGNIDKNEPIFEIAPTKINGKLKDSYTYDSGDDSSFDIKVDGGSELKLYYHDFTANFKDDSSNETLVKLNSIYNTYDINALIEFSCEPSGIALLLLKAESSDTRVAYITSSGQIVVVKTGECTLTFSSLLDPDICWSIKLNVVAPISAFVLSETIDGEKVENSYIAVEKSKQYFHLTSGVRVFGRKQYSFVAENNLGYDVVINYIGSSPDVEVEDYISICGKTGSSARIEIGGSLSLKVLEKLEDSVDYFKVEVTPYVSVSGTKVVLPDMKTSFNVYTREGVKSISLKTNSAILYPNNETEIVTYVYTDAGYDDGDFVTSIKDGNGKVVDFASISVLNVGELNTNKKLQIIKFKLTISKFYDECETGEITPINFAEKVKQGLFIYNKTTEEYNQLTLSSKFVAGTKYYKYASQGRTIYIDISISGKNVSASAEYLVLPQAIDDIEVNNYYYELKQGETAKYNIIESNILKPSVNGENNGGLIILDMAPNNAYYDYLTIKDITGDQEIWFIQTENDNTDRTNLSVVDTETTSDGKGIILKKRPTYYIFTQIAGMGDSKYHTVEISAYLNSGTLLHTTTKTIDVKMLPSIQVQYKLPNGAAETANTLDGTRLKTKYFANNTKAEFYITTKEADDPYVEIKSVEYSGITCPYEFVRLDNVPNFYQLRTKEGTLATADDIGKTIKITLLTKKTYDNQMFEEQTMTLEFKIASFVIHSVSVSPSTDNYIYGNTGTETTLEYYFKDGDVSFYKDGEYWNQEYYKQDSQTNYNELSIHEKELVNILTHLNNDEENSKTYLSNNEYLKLTDSEDLLGLTLNKNKLKVSAEYNTDAKFAVNFVLKLYDSGAWRIDGDLQIDSDTPVTPEQSYTIKQLYDIKFVEKTSPNKPKLIKNETDFLNMTSGKNYYILGNDLVLTNYTPLDIEILEFDGNGRTITIESFDSFDESEIKAGLFKTISEGMVVKNINLKYMSTYDRASGRYSFGRVSQNGDAFAYEYGDLCTKGDVNYTSAKFGGITAENNGIITNCKVDGTIVLRASTIENTSTEKKINFNIGGVVCDNTDTGFITNSTSCLNIFAKTDIGGFVNKNEGKIVSCGVEDVTIYTRNANVGTNIEVYLGGFVVDNLGEISMSYVSLAGNSKLTTKCGTADPTTIEVTATMTANDISAGFAYRNSGDIKDAYVNISLVRTGEQGNSNEFYGFVFDQGGTIANAYTFINGGEWEATSWRMFAPLNTGGLTDCIEFLDMTTPNYIKNNGGTEGLVTVTKNDTTKRSKYEENNFSFGDNKSGVWTSKSGKVPMLTSTLEKVEYTAGDEPDGEVEGGTSPRYYYGLKNIEVIRVEDNTSPSGYSYEAVTNDATYGTKDNPIIIANLDAWDTYMIESNAKCYFRIVADLDFASVGKTPNTSTMTFRGNIQGNNMVISNYMLSSTLALESIGLFKDLQGLGDPKITNSIRNMTLNASSVWATKTEAVGLLAGKSKDFNLYNITADAEGLIVVGGNAVGGIVGLVQGVFDIEKIYSNVGANSTMESNATYLTVFMSKNNACEEDNLSNVYYAGAVFGILDAYDASYYNINSPSNSTRNIDKNYFNVRYITVSGSEMFVLGNIAGGAFGYVGERVYTRDIEINISSGKLGGRQYTGGVAGENRGVVRNSKVVLGEDIDYTDSNYVTAGVVGMNLGGLVIETNVKANIIKYATNYTTTAGIVGRNFFGTITNATFDGKLQGYYVGGIVGADYSNFKNGVSTLLNRTSGSGALSTTCRSNAVNIIPGSIVEYLSDNQTVERYKNLVLTKETVFAMTNTSANSKKPSITNYYWFNSGENTLETSMTRYYSFGLIAGITDLPDEQIVQNFGLDKNSNFKVNSSAYVSTDINDYETKNQISIYSFTVKQGENWFTPNVKDLKSNETEVSVLINTLAMSGIERDTLLYLIGVNTEVFDAWDRTSYSGMNVILQKNTSGIDWLYGFIRVEKQGENFISIIYNSSTYDNESIKEKIEGTNYKISDCTITIGSTVYNGYSLTTCTKPETLTTSATLQDDKYTWIGGEITVDGNSITYLGVSYEQIGETNQYQNGNKIIEISDSTITMITNLTIANYYVVGSGS